MLQQSRKDSFAHCWLQMSRLHGAAFWQELQSEDEPDMRNVATPVACGPAAAGSSAGSGRPAVIAARAGPAQPGTRRASETACTCSGGSANEVLAMCQHPTVQAAGGYVELLLHIVQVLHWRHM